MCKTSLKACGAKGLNHHTYAALFLSVYISLKSFVLSLYLLSPFRCWQKQQLVSLYGMYARCSESYCSSNCAEWTEHSRQLHSYIYPFFSCFETKETRDSVRILPRAWGSITHLSFVSLCKHMLKEKWWKTNLQQVILTEWRGREACV